ncbi:MAG: beta-propeller domain-containing protein [Oscillospiraceae bacterium]|jgi:hypothetical protein|nr:beta-propeller domain-containing protein [Oscillospiraceae bacterium]
MTPADNFADRQMSAAEFLAEIKKERFSGREFLALIGNTRISNESYSEIKGNPSLTYARLVEILENSPLDGRDFSDLLRVARERRAARELKKKRAALEKDLNDVIASKSPQDAPERREEAATRRDAPKTHYITDKTRENINIGNSVPSGVTDEITLSHGEQDSLADEAAYDDLWGDEQGYADGYSGDYTDEYYEYGGSEDFDKNASRENRWRKAVCLSASAALVFMSFFIRFTATGEWLLPDNRFKPPAAYEELFAVQAKQSGQIKERAAAQRLYRAEKFSDGKKEPAALLVNSEYIFKTDGNAVRAVKISAGEMFDAGAYERADAELIGVFLLKERLYAVYSGEYEVAFEYAVETDGTEPRAAEFKFAQPCVSVVVFDANSFNAAPSAEYTQDGVFFDMVIRDGEFFLITDYAVSNGVYAGEYDGYIPAARLNGQKSRVAIENIFVREAPYSDMTVIGGMDAAGERVSFYAVTGGLADFVRGGETSLMLIFNDGAKAHAVKYNIYENGLNAPVLFSVEGTVPEGFADDRNGVTRVAAVVGEEGEQSVTLHIFASNTKPVSAERIARGETLKGAAFDDGAVYIVARQLYAIDTSEPGVPVFMNETNALISSEYYYGFGGDLFFSVNVEAHEDGKRLGVRVAMYGYGEQSAPQEIASVLLAPSAAQYGEYMKTPAEHSRHAVAASADSGIIVVPIIDFNGIVRIEKFVILRYGDGGFEITGNMIDVDRFSDDLAAVISEGYIYAFWDDTIKSATSDGRFGRVFDMSR